MRSDGAGLWRLKMEFGFINVIIGAGRYSGAAL